MLSESSVKKPMTVVVAVICVLILGAVSFSSLKTDLLPELEMPSVLITTAYPGASPEKVEIAVTKPLEEALTTVSGLENITSVSTENYSQIAMEFSYSVNMDSTIIEINNKINSTAGEFDDEIGTPSLLRISPNLLPLAGISVVMEEAERSDLTRMIQEEIVPALEKANGVSSVEAFGMLQNRIDICLSQEKIDVLNNKVLTSVDATLSETETGLKSNRNKLESGKKQFYSEIDKKQREANSVLEEINSNISTATIALPILDDQIRTAAAEIAGYNAEIAVLEQAGGQEAELRRLTDSRAAAQQKMDQLSAMRGETQTGLDTLNVQKKAILDGIASANVELRDYETNLLMMSTLQEVSEQQFEIERDSALAQANLSGIFTQRNISAILMAQNVSMPAGILREDDNQTYTVKVGDELNSIESLKELVLFNTNIENVGTVVLSDVADVILTDNTNDSFVKVNGNDGVILHVFKQNSYSTNEVSQELKAIAAELEASHPGLNLTFMLDQGGYIDIVVDSFFSNLAMGAVFAVLILLVFLQTVKPTLIIALSIPISLLLAVVLMYFTNINLNIISLAGLILGVGMLVDNSIVAIENIYRLRNEGMDPKEAAIIGTKQIAAAITSSTLTTVCVFLPIVFTDGMSRQIFSDMGLTIAYSLLASLAVALYVVPALSATILRTVEEKPVRWFESLTNGYVKLLKACLKHKAIPLTLVIVLFLGSVAGAYFAGTAFIPGSDMAQILVQVDAPRELPVDEVRGTVQEMADIFTAYEDVEVTAVLDGEQENSFQIYILLKETRQMTNSEISSQITADTRDYDCEVTISSGAAIVMSMVPGNLIQVLIQGDDFDQLRAIAKNIAGRISTVEGIEDVEDGTLDATPEIRIAVDKNKAMEYNLTVAQIYALITSELQTDLSASTVMVGRDALPVNIVKDVANRMTKESLEAMTIEVTENGIKKDIPLSRIASFADSFSLPQITRDNLRRSITVTATIASDYNIGLVSRDVASILSTLHLPDGYRYSLEGDNEMINDSLRDLGFMLLISLSLIFLIMVAQFQSFISPFIVMFTIPLAFTGGLLSLELLGFELSVISALGFLILAGVVVNNGIVFVDYANQLMDEGKSRYAALIETGRTRMRPILMTALTTILGLITMGLGIGQGTEMLQPMAVVVIFGLAYATFLTLIIIPILYDIILRNKGNTDRPAARDIRKDLAARRKRRIEEEDRIYAFKDVV